MCSYNSSLAALRSYEFRIDVFLQVNDGWVASTTRNSCT